MVENQRLGRDSVSRGKETGPRDGPNQVGSWTFWVLQIRPRLNLVTVPVQHDISLDTVEGTNLVRRRRFTLRSK